MKRTQWLDNIKQSLVVKKSRQRRRGSQSKHLQFNQLEKRNLLAAVSFSEGGLFFFADAGQEDSVTVETLDVNTLSVTVGNGDSITLNPSALNNSAFDVQPNGTLAVDVGAINALSFVLGDGNDFFSSAALTNDLNISVFAGDGDDVVQGGGNSETFLGGHGDDTISGGGNNDTISGGFGSDTLNGGAGNDILDGAQSIDLPSEPSIATILTGGVGLAQTAQANQVNGDTFVDGDNFGVTFTLFVENTGDAPLQDIALFNDLADQLGTAFDSVSFVAVENFSGGGTLPVVSAAFTGDTSQNILQTGSTLLPGDSFQVRVVAQLDSGNTIQTAVSSATATGVFADANQTLSDVSDSGTSTTGTNPGASGDMQTDADPTPVPASPELIFAAAEMPDIGLAQTVRVVSSTFGTPVIAQGDEVQATVNLFIENTGNVELIDLELNSDFADQLGLAGFVSVDGVTLRDFSGAGAVPTINPAFANDTSLNILQTGSSLSPGASFEVVLTLTLAPAASFDAAISATASGTANGFFSSETVSDQSDSGTSPTGNNPLAPGDTGGEDDPTPIAISVTATPVPSIGLAQTAQAETIDLNINPFVPGEDFQATFTVFYENTGNQPLTDLVLNNDLAAQLGSALVSVDSVTLQNFVGAGIAPTINPAFEANTSLNILQSGSLAAGTSFEVFFIVTLDSDNTSAGTTISATGSGSSDLGVVSDASDSGTSTTGTNPGAPGDTGGSDDATPVPFNPAFIIPGMGDDPGIGLALSALPSIVVGVPGEPFVGEFDTTFTVFYENTGDVPLTDLVLNIDFEGQLGNALVSVFGVSLENFTGQDMAPMGTEPALNVGFALDSSLNVLIPNRILLAGDSFEVVFSTVLDSGSTIGGATISATASASFNNGIDSGVVSDTSDSGSDTTGTNPDAPGDTGGSDDPTPVPTGPFVLITSPPPPIPEPGLPGVPTIPSPPTPIPIPLPVVPTIPSPFVTQAVSATAVEKFDGDDTITGGSGNDIIFGDAGNDVLAGGAGNDTILGGEGNDNLFGGNGDDEIFGQQGDDFIDGGVGVDAVNGGTGIDTNSFQGGNEGVSAVFTIGGDGSAEATSGAVEEFTEIESLTGSNFADELIAVGTGDTTIRGLGGDDVIQSSSGNDLLVGNDGNDILRSGEGNDRIFGGSGNDTLNGGAGGDLLNGQDGDDFLIGLSGVDQVVGGDGTDTISFQDSTVGVTATIFSSGFGTVNFGGASEETFFSTENIIGTPQNDTLSVFLTTGTELQGLGGDDVLTGGIGDDVLLGSAGNDILRGGFGNDSLFGGDGSDALNAGGGDDSLAGNAGDDTFQGGNGNDRLFGGEGNDFLNGGNGDDLINGNAGNDSLFGGAGLDRILGGGGFDVISFVGSGQGVDATLAGNGNGSAQQSGQGVEFFSGIESLQGSEFDDVLTALGLLGRNIFGLGGDDVILGSFGNDRILGGSGDDTIDGRFGADSIFGNAGNDELLGGLGDDVLLGGDGDDLITDTEGNNFIQD